jgi:hypothetical protein
MYQVTLDPTDAVDVANEGTATFSDPTIEPAYTVTYPNGPGKADYMTASVYADGSSISSRKLLVSNEGDILDIPGSANSGTFLRKGSFNLEMVVNSSLFQGRNIDVLFAPEILSQKSNAIADPGTSNIR